MTAGDFLAAARRILAERGCEALTVAGLCEALSITKGSFNHHFASLEHFVQHLSEDWERRRVEWLGRCAARPDPSDRLALLHEPMIAPVDPAEVAWRAWGWTQETVAQALIRTDRAWQDLLTETLLALGFEEDTASLLAETGVALMIGLQQREADNSYATAGQIAQEWLYHGLHVGVELRCGQPHGNRAGTRGRR